LDLIVIEQQDVFLKLEYEVLLNSVATKDLIVQLFRLNLKLETLIKSCYYNRDMIYRQEFTKLRTNYTRNVCELIEKIAISENDNQI